LQPPASVSHRPCADRSPPTRAAHPHAVAVDRRVELAAALVLLGESVEGGAHETLARTARPCSDRRADRQEGVTEFPATTILQQEYAREVFGRRHMTASEDQAEAERAIFIEFAATVPLAVNSIESRRPPEPDLLCDVEGEGPVAFEVSQVTNESLERAMRGDHKARQEFRAAYNALPSEARLRIVDCLGGVPAVFVGFTPGTPPGQWRRAIKPIIDLLVARSNLSGDERLRAGDVSVWQLQGLSSILTEMAVRASSTAGPFLGCTEAVEVTDTTRRVLTKKLTSRYSSAAPMELLLYRSTPVPRATDWREDLITYIDHQPVSPFRRVWCFDLFDRAVALVHPER